MQNSSCRGQNRYSEVEDILGCDRCLRHKLCAYAPNDYRVLYAEEAMLTSEESAENAPDKDRHSEPRCSSDDRCCLEHSHAWQWLGQKSDGSCRCNNTSFTIRGTDQLCQPSLAVEDRQAVQSAFPSFFGGSKRTEST